MDFMQSTDYMKFESNRLAFSFVNNDIVFFSGEIFKHNRYWKRQKRILCITSKYVLNLKRDRNRLDANNNPDLTGLQMRRCIDINHLAGVTKSLHPRSLEFVIHVPREYDYRYEAPNERIRDEIIQALKVAFISTAKYNLNIYGVKHQYLGKFTKTSTHNPKICKMPDRKYLLTDELVPIEVPNQSLGPDSDPDKEINILENEDFELIPNYMSKGSRDTLRSIKKTKSADLGTLASSGDYKGINVNAHDNDPDYSSDEEEKKMQDEIDDDDLEITFDINDEAVDLLDDQLFETIYSKSDLDSQVKAQDFALKRVLRETSTGKVYLAEHKITKKCYAMKSIKKDEFLKHTKSVMIQSELGKLSHFICSLEYVLQSEYRVYLVYELLQGGELGSLIKKQKVLDEELAKFYLAQLALVLGFLHSQDIIFRNLQTSNILINNDGYIKLGDFDCCGKVSKDSLNLSVINLKEYQAPEIRNNQGYDQTIDWWALGVVLCQMLFTESILVDGCIEFPEDSKISTEAKDLITKLLQKDKSQRLGAKHDHKEILAHPFFDEIDTDKLLKKQVEPPYVPFVHPLDPYFIANFDLELGNRAPRESVINEKEKEHIERQSKDLQQKLDECIKVI